MARRKLNLRDEESAKGDWEAVFDFYSAPQCFHCKRCTSYGNSVRLSIRPSVTRRYCVKTTARSMVQFADSKICLLL